MLTLISSGEGHGSGRIFADYHSTFGISLFEKAQLISELRLWSGSRRYSDEKTLA